MKKSIFLCGCIFVAFTFLGLQACADTNVKLNPEDDGVICTYDFRTVHAYVADADGNGILLDSVRTTWGKEELIAKAIDASVYDNFPENEPYPYPVVDDAWQKDFKSKEEVVVFTGYKDGMEVVTGELKITADECHVSTMESDKVLIGEVPSQVACTEVFMILMAYVKDKDGEPYLLDSISSTWNDKILIAEKIDNSQADFYPASEGLYPVVDDGSRSYFIDKTETVEFRGFKNNKQVVSGQMKVSADICHIQSVEEIPTFVVSEETK